MSESQGELFTDYNPGDARLETFKGRQKLIKRIIAGWERGGRRRKETKAEHQHAENGGTDYMRNAFREV